MDYLKFYELEKAPFQNDPDEHFFFESAAHRRALAHLWRGIHQHKALSVLVGEAGSGKTTLATRISSGLDPQKYRSQLLLISHADCAHGWLLPTVARAFGVREPADTAPAQLDQIRAAFVAHRKKGRHPVLMVDEAQLLSNLQVMEEFRGILNLTLDGARLVSIVLFGLPDLSELLRLDAPLAQRVEVRADVQGLPPDELKSYVKHRLEKAGGRSDLFSEEALDALHAFGHGIPRVTNTLADNALFEAFLSETRPVDASLVTAAAEQLEIATVPPPDPTHAPGPGTATGTVPSQGPPTGMLGVDSEADLDLLSLDPSELEGAPAPDPNDDSLSLGAPLSADQLPDGPATGGGTPSTDSAASQPLGIDLDLEPDPSDEDLEFEDPSEAEVSSPDLGDGDATDQALAAESDGDSSSEDIVLEDEDLESIDVELEAVADAPEPESEPDPVEDRAPDTSSGSGPESQFDLADLLEEDETEDNDDTDTGHDEDLPVQATATPRPVEAEVEAVAADDGETFDPAELLLSDEQVIDEPEATPVEAPDETPGEDLDKLFDSIQVD